MSEDKKTYPAGKHPNSLAALGSAWNSETAKEAQLLGAKKRSLNAQLRKEMKLSMQMWKEMQDELAESRIDSVEILRMLAYKKLDEGDEDGAVDILKSIAEYEKPKLARVENKVEEVDASDMSDEELMERLKRLAN